MSSWGGRGNYRNKKQSESWVNYESSNTSSPEVPQTKQYHLPEKSLSCNKCHRQFNLTTLFPILFDCGHSECEECIIVTTTCSTCNVGQLPSGLSSKRKENLPINYYIVGKLLCRNFERKNQDRSGSVHIPFVSVAARKKCDNTFGTKCSSRVCNRQATLRCVDCLEVYCSLCSNNLHQSAKGLMTHQIVSLSVSMCEQHEGNLEEFQCMVCEMLICSYCAIANHNGHAIKQITKLDILDVPKMERLLHDCHRTLQKLGQVEKKVQQQIANKNDSIILNAENVEQEINKSFLELHAKLQLQEAKLTSKIKSMIMDKILDKRDKLATQIQEINSIVALAQNILVNCHMPGQNISKVMETMEKVRQFQMSDYDQRMFFVYNCDDNLLKNLENNFSLKLKIKDNYKQNRNSNPNRKGSSSVNNDGTSTDSSMSSSISSSGQARKPNSVYSSYSSLWSSSLYDVAHKSRNRNVPITRCADRMPEPFEKKMLKKNDKEYVRITHIESPDKFYVQINSQNKQLQLLNRMLVNHFKARQRNPVEKPLINEHYIVNNKVWCRATCLSENPDGTFKLYLIDYGNVIIASKKMIFEITPELANKPQLSYCCKLNAYPITDEWGSEVITLVKDIVLDCNVLMIVYNETNGVLLVDIIASCEDVEYSLRDSLLFIGYAKLFDDNVNVDLHPKISQLHTFSIHSQSLQIFKTNQKLQVYISHVNNPLDLYVQLQDFQDKLDVLNAEMSLHYSTMKKGFVFKPEVGMIVAVNKTNDKITWHRGQINEIISGHAQIAVMLVDFGETIVVRWNQIKRMDEKFVALNCLATNVKLVHIENKQSKWKEECIDHLKKFAVHREMLEMAIEDNSRTPYSVVLFEKQIKFDLCINAELAMDSSIRSTGHLSTKWKFPKLQTTAVESLNDDDDDDGGSAEDDEEDDDLYVRKPIEVLHCKNGGSIYIHFTQESSVMQKLVELNIRLQTYCNVNGLKGKEKWQKGEIGVAIDYTKKQYFRILVEEVLNDKYLVLSQDYAHPFYAKNDDIGILDDSFLTLPPFAYRCHLYGVKPSASDWSLASRDYLNDYFNKKNIYFTMAGPCENQSSPAIFWHKELKTCGALESCTFKMHNINKKLIKNGFAIKDKIWDIPKYQTQDLTLTKSQDNSTVNKNLIVDGRKGTWIPALPLTSTNFDTVATYVDNDCLIYFNESADEKLLKTMMTTMTKYFNQVDSCQNEIIWEVGDRCSVKYTRNQNWYRGIVCRNGNDIEKTIVVCLIDYGNVEEVEPNEIHCDIMYEDVPILGKCVKLNGVDPPEGGYTILQLDTIHSCIVGKSIHVYVKQVGVISEAIIHQGNKVLNEFMSIKLNCLLQSLKQQKPIWSSSSCALADDDDDADAIVESVDSNSSLFGESLPDYASKQLPNEESFTATIVNYIDYNRIVFMLADETDKDKLEFEELTLKIEAEGPLQPFLNIFDFYHPCIALYQSQFWYRALIFHHNPDQNMVRVFFVDFGDLEYLDESEVRVVKSEWLEYPMRQCNALIYGFDSIKEEDKVHVFKVLDTFYDTIKRIKIVEMHPLTVQLFDLDDNKLAYESLISRGILNELNEY